MYFVMTIPPSSLLSLHSKSLAGASGDELDVSVELVDELSEPVDVSEDELSVLLVSPEEGFVPLLHAVDDISINAAVITLSIFFADFHILTLSTIMIFGTARCSFTIIHICKNIVKGILGIIVVF